jgi:hypothetical protein
MNQFVDLSLAIAEPSVWELVIGGAVSLVFLAVFLRMKLG